MTKIHPQLAQDCLLLGRFPLCHLLLNRDANYPWFILVPDRENIREIHELSEKDQQQLLSESVFFSRCLQQIYTPDKLNIAALGNVVPQLHVHHIARYRHDACWPAPVWGAVPATAYTDEQITHIKQRLENWFQHNTAQVFNGV
ncbi:MAG TPA: HIT domain-containing protein [Gammaproteobacteria bacterium]|nr:HIT domain-containing protein [Gammaproteobacteria bacterium]